MADKKGPKKESILELAKLMDAGMNVARFNFSHGSHEGHGAVLDRLREVAMEKSRNIAGTCCLCAYEFAGFVNTNSCN